MYGLKKQIGQKIIKFLFTLKIITPYGSKILIRFSKTVIMDCHQNVYRSIFINVENVVKSCYTES